MTGLGAFQNAKQGPDTKRASIIDVFKRVHAHRNVVADSLRMMFEPREFAIASSLTWMGMAR